MNDRLYYNGSGVKDPTAFKAIRRIMRDEKRKNRRSDESQSRGQFWGRKQPDEERGHRESDRHLSL